MEEPRGLHVRRFPLAIALSGDEARQRRADAAAARWLREAGADVIVWGQSKDRSDADICVLAAASEDRRPKVIPINFVAKKERFAAGIAAVVAYQVARGPPAPSIVLRPRAWTSCAAGPRSWPG